VSPRRSWLVATFACVALVAVGAPIAAASGPEQTPPAPKPKVLKVKVGDNFFKPKKATITAGTTVRWTNVGRVLHNVLPNKGSLYGTDSLPVDDVYEFTFTKPGTYKYYCSFHGAPGVGQWGQITVKRPPRPPPPPTSTTTPTSAAAASAVSKLSAAAGAGASVIRVPADEATIQAAVDAAKPGALVLVSPGTYTEEVTVTTPRIVIRGVDRNRTIVDGGLELDNGFKVLEADGVAIENITAQNFKVNGFYWSGVDGYRGSYLTSVRNGDYGIFAFDSVNGQFDHSYASGSPDAGFYIGQCKECNALIVDVEAEWNGLGYSGTNSGGNLLIARSSFHDNRGGVVPNSGTGELNPPEEDTTIIGNRVYDNNNSQSAAIEIAETATGNGILLAGANLNTVERNLVTGHDISGIAAVPLPEKTLNPSDPSAVDFDARDNVVRDNVARDNQYDLAVLATVTDAADAGGNCFSGNEATTSLPADVQDLLPCGKPADSAFQADVARFAELLLAEQPPSADYTAVDLPDASDQKNMPRAKTAKARPAVNEPSIKINPDKLRVPKGSSHR